MRERSRSHGHYRFGWQGRFETHKEINKNNNLVDWGGYGYDPRIGQRFTRDMLHAKYSWISPYSALGNNPVLHQELDGKDYAVYINHDTKTIIIRATQYTKFGDTKSFHSAIASTKYWNDRSRQYQYRVKTVEKRGILWIFGRQVNHTDYDIDFKLQVKIVDEPDKQVRKDRIGRERAIEASIVQITTDKSSNSYSVRSDGDAVFQNDDPKKETNGITSLGIQTFVKESEKFTDTGPHEIGHQLGLLHYPRGLMTSAQNDPNRSSELGSTAVKDMLIRAIKWKDGPAGEGNLIFEGGAPSKFSRGKVQRTE